MKAIYISDGSDLNRINSELKDCKCIVEKLSINGGYILILDNVTRKDKLEKLKKISDE